MSYWRLAFSCPSVVITNRVRSGTSSGRAYRWTFPMWWIAPPMASSSAVDPPTEYSASVRGLTSFTSARSWRTSLWSLKRTVETRASPSPFLCFSIMALKPPMVSDSRPLMEPLRSRINTTSVRFSLIFKPSCDRRRAER